MNDKIKLKGFFELEVEIFKANIVNPESISENAYINQDLFFILKGFDSISLLNSIFESIDTLIIIIVRMFGFQKNNSKNSKESIIGWDKSPNQSIKELSDKFSNSFQGLVGKNLVKTDLNLGSLLDYKEVLKMLFKKVNSVIETRKIYSDLYKNARNVKIPEVVNGDFLQSKYNKKTHGLNLKPELVLSLLLDEISNENIKHQDISNKDKDIYALGLFIDKKLKKHTENDFKSIPRAEDKENVG